MIAEIVDWKVFRQKFPQYIFHDEGKQLVVLGVVFLHDVQRHDAGVRRGERKGKFGGNLAGDLGIGKLTGQYFLQIIIFQQFSLVFDLTPVLAEHI